MASDWNSTTLGSLLKFANGRSSPSRNDGDPVRVYGSNGVIGYCQETNAEAGTIIVGRVGSYCGSTYLSKDACWVTDNAIKANPLPGNDSRFLFYLLDTLDLNSRASGSGQPLLNQSILSCIDVVAPPLPEQNAIAHILGSLDDKIELNRRMNETLEGMAQALFKSWFVDFDPVIDNALAAGNPIPEEFADRAQTRQKVPDLGKAATEFSNVRKNFPDSFQPSELGPIPTGWEVKPIVEHVHLTMGQSPSSDHYNKDGNGLPFHQGVTNYGERFPKHEQYSTGGTRYAEEGDVLFSVRAPVGRINIANCRIIIGRGLSALRHNRDYQSFLVYFLKHTFQKEDSIGSGTIFNAVNKKEVERIPFIIPIDEITKEFDEIANALDEKIASNAEETEVLTKLRDTLLPMLISGELRIEDAEKMVGNSV